jgi:hypothetical protein
MVWPRFGDVRNYCEPFFFSGAMLLLRPDPPQIETVNDLNAFVSNFWRAIQHDPEAVAAHADWPVNETDLHSRHRWLVYSDEARAILQRVRESPDAFDAKVAGWWCWGACMWIGSGWCDQAQAADGSTWIQRPVLDGGRGIISEDIGDKRPQLCNGTTRYGQGVHKQGPEKRPRLASHSAGGASGNQPAQPGTGVHGRPNVQRPYLSNGHGSDGPGVLNRPQLADAYSRGRGVHGNDALTDCQHRRAWLIDWFSRLSDRLRSVRVCCGHWSRICDSDSTLTRLGTTGVFLDPPYRHSLDDGTENRAKHLYANDKHQDVNALCDEVQEWCLKWGDNPEIRIALCGLEGEYPKLDGAGWEKEAWKSRGGYGNRSDRGKENAARERIWYSPACLSGAKVPTLFDEEAA